MRKIIDIFTTFKKLYPLFLALLIFVVLYLFSTNIPPENVSLFIKRFGPTGPILLTLLFLLTNVIAPLSPLPFYFAGFYVFGHQVIFYSLIAYFTSSVINFWIAKRWGRGLVAKFVGKSNMDKIDKLTQNYGVPTLFFLRVSEAGIGDYISYAAGLTSINFRTYILVSTLGMIPGAALWSFLSLQTKSPLEFTLLTVVMAAVFAGVFILVNLAIKWWKEKDR